MVPLEVCINCDSPQGVRDAVGAAYRGGAATVELCRAMQHEGLTPTREHMAEARDAFGDRAGLFVMIRPRPGGFSYSRAERDTMLDQIRTAAETGADGIVFGVLRAGDGRLCPDALREMVEAGRRYRLKVAFHRAFDAAPDPVETLEGLIDAGLDRLLTSGTAWGAGESALQGLRSLQQLCAVAGTRIEIVIGGGVHGGNVAALLEPLPLAASRVAVHAYSGVQERGVTTERAVRALVEALQQGSA